MSQIIATINFVVNPASTTQPLAFTPNPNLQPDTENVDDPGQILGEVTGGVAPYTFSASDVPSGMELAQQPDADGVGVDVVISGTPATGDSTASPYSIVLTINDSATPSAQVKVKIPVKKAQ